MGAEEQKRMEQLFHKCNTEEDIQRISNDSQIIDKRLNELNNSNWQNDYPHRSIDEVAVKTTLQNKHGRHLCKPAQFGGVGYNGRWCRECGCLFSVLWRKDSHHVHGYEDKLELVWRPIGQNPKTCNCKYCVTSEYFSDAVLTRTSIKYCLECGSIYPEYDTGFGANRKRGNTKVSPTVCFGSAYVPDMIKSINRDLINLNRERFGLRSRIASLKKQMAELKQLEREHTNKYVAPLVGRKSKTRKRIFYREAVVDMIMNELGNGEFKL